jgi:hypothetical protein
MESSAGRRGKRQVIENVRHIGTGEDSVKISILSEANSLHSPETQVMPCHFLSFRAWEALTGGAENAK